MTALTSFPYKPLISSSVKSSFPIDVTVFVCATGASAISLTLINSSVFANISLQTLATSTFFIGCPLKRTLSLLKVFIITHLFSAGLYSRVSNTSYPVFKITSQLGFVPILMTSLFLKTFSPCVDEITIAINYPLFYYYLPIA